LPQAKTNIELQNPGLVAFYDIWSRNIAGLFLQPEGLLHFLAGNFQLKLRSSVCRHGQTWSDVVRCGPMR